MARIQRAPCVTFWRFWTSKVVAARLKHAHAPNSGTLKTDRHNLPGQLLTLARPQGPGTESLTPTAKCAHGSARGTCHSDTIAGHHRSDPSSKFLIRNNL